MVLAEMPRDEWPWYALVKHPDTREEQMRFVNACYIAKSINSLILQS